MGQFQDSRHPSIGGAAGLIQGRNDIDAVIIKRTLLTKPQLERTINRASRNEHRIREFGNRQHCVRNQPARFLTWPERR
jgi:hypothetical protein